MMIHITKHAVVTIMIIILISCAQQPIVVQKTEATDLVWPPRPEVSRIRYLYSINSAEDMDIRPGLFGMIARFFKGEEERNIVRPYGIWKDAQEKLYIVDTFYRRVHVFDRKNATHYLFPDTDTKIEMETFMNPIDVAVGMSGQVYVSDSESNLIHVFADSGKRYIKSIGAGELKRPTGLAIDTEKNQLIVADTLASSLIVFDEKKLNVVAVIGSESEGKEGFHYPTNVTLGHDNNIYVTDGLNYRVQILNRKLQFVHAFGAAGDSPGHFSRPKGIATDSEGNVYVVDALFGNVQIFDAQGRLLLVFGRPGHKLGEFWLPNAIFIDNEDRIYISDAYNQRLQVFQYLPYGDKLR